MSIRRFSVLSLAVFGCGFAAGPGCFDLTPAANIRAGRFTSCAPTRPEGKLPNLLTRFRDHTLHFFERHGMSRTRPRPAIP